MFLFDKQNCLHFTNVTNRYLLLKCIAYNCVLLKGFPQNRILLMNSNLGNDVNHIILRHVLLVLIQGIYKQNESKFRNDNEEGKTYVYYVESGSTISNCVRNFEILIVEWNKIGSSFEIRIWKIFLWMDD